MTTSESTTYRAGVVRTPGDEDAIEFLDLPRPELEAGQVRVAVKAAPVNPVDLTVRSGRLHEFGLIHQPDHTGLGWDFSGEVIEAGPGVDLAVGTRVAGLVGGFDRDFGTYADELVLPAAAVAVVPDSLDLVDAATVPLNALTAAQLVDLLGEPEPGHNRLLVTGAGGAVGGYVLPLARERGWQVTGLARESDADFVRSQGAELVTEPTTGWDVVADPAVLQEQAVALVRDGGLFVGVQSAMVPASERGVRTTAVAVEPDGVRTAGLLERTASGELPVRVAAVLPLTQAADAHRAVAQGGVRGRYVLVP